MRKVVGANAENVVGFVPLPVGVVGPLLLDGRPLHVPLATTEGALIASTNRGARALHQSGGVTSVCLADGMTRAPLVACTDLLQAAAIKAYCEAPEHLADMQNIFSSTSRFGALLGVKVAIAGRHAYLRFKCATGDAMGMNMVGKGVNTLMAALLDRFEGAELMALSGNCTRALARRFEPSRMWWVPLRHVRAAIHELKSTRTRVCLVAVERGRGGVPRLATIGHLSSVGVICGSSAIAAPSRVLSLCPHACSQTALIRSPPP